MLLFIYFFVLLQLTVLECLKACLPLAVYRGLAWELADILVNPTVVPVVSTEGWSLMVD